MRYVRTDSESKAFLPSFTTRGKELKVGFSEVAGGRNLVNLQSWGLDSWRLRYLRVYGTLRAPRAVLHKLVQGRRSLRHLPGVNYLSFHGWRGWVQGLWLPVDPTGYPKEWR